MRKVFLYCALFGLFVAGVTWFSLKAPIWGTDRPEIPADLVRGHFLQVKGDVKTRTDILTSWYDPDKGVPFMSGQMVFVGPESEVVLETLDKGRIRIGPNSLVTLHLDQNEPRVFLDFGSLEVQPAGAKEFVVQTGLEEARVKQTLSINWTKIDLPSEKKKMVVKAAQTGAVEIRGSALPSIPLERVQSLLKKPTPAPTPTPTPAVAEVKREPVDLSPPRIRSDSPSLLSPAPSEFHIELFASAYPEELDGLGLEWQVAADAEFSKIIGRQASPRTNWKAKFRQNRTLFFRARWALAENRSKWSGPLEVLPFIEPIEEVDFRIIGRSRKKGHGPLLNVKNPARFEGSVTELVLEVAGASRRIPLAPEETDFTVEIPPEQTVRFLIQALEESTANVRAMSRPRETRYVPGQAPGPVLASPVDNSSLLVTNTGPVAVEFAWKAVLESQGYEIEIANDPGFKQILARRVVIGSGWGTELSKPAEIIYWRVRTLTDETESPWTEPRKLRIRRPRDP